MLVAMHRTFGVALLASLGFSIRTKREHKIGAGLATEVATCESVLGTQVCVGQFGNQECLTCGDRIDAAKATGLSDEDAKQYVADNFYAICGPCSITQYVLSNDGYQLVWQDEFDATSKTPVDTAKWNLVDKGDGFGNNELQYYTPRADNSWVSDGTLKINAKYESWEGMQYTSAKLESQQSWLYGKFTVRSKMTTGRGTWAAIWTMPKESVYGIWPKSGEIDIMEHVGFDTGKVHGTVHCQAYHHSIGTQKGGSVDIDVTQWHVYTVEWRPDIILFAADGVVYQIFKKEPEADSDHWPFNTPFYVILNMAVGGDWGGQKGIDEEAFKGDGQFLEVDYVRVEQDPCTVALDTQVCIGQFGNQECLTCGQRLDAAKATGLSDIAAKQYIADNFYAACGACSQVSYELSSDGYESVWKDDFDSDATAKAVDSTKWDLVDKGDGFGNNELQYYTPRLDNSYVSDGTLKIKAKLEDWKGMKYTSAKLTSKENWLYGKFNVRAKMTTGKGTWAAIWTMPQVSSYGIWPKSGEIDIMEHVGFDTGKVHGTVHCQAYHHSLGTQKGGSVEVDVTQWHVYTVEWRKDIILFACDGKVYQIFKHEASGGTDTWPFNTGFYVILNMAVGGDWGGQQGIDDEAFKGDGQILEVDYVHVEQKDECKAVTNEQVCIGQFGNQECLTCGQRIAAAENDGMSNADAKQYVADNFYAICGVCSSEYHFIGVDGYELKWQDEFDSGDVAQAVDTNKWALVDQGDGFGNRELQYYTPRMDNSYMSGGSMKIKAKLEDWKGMKYTSAKLTSKENWLYGKFVVRAKMSTGRGTWAAIWTMPQESKYGIWPKSGEIDIMEHVGFDTGKVHGTVHCQAYHHTLGTQKGGSVLVDVTQFHVYTVEWKEDIIYFALDDAIYQVFKHEAEGGTDTWPFDTNFYVILNMAVGGDWGGQQGIDDDAFRGNGQTLEVDYVRVYQRPPKAADDPGYAMGSSAAFTLFSFVAFLFAIQ